jgi:CubicO group peptidase (beta-lactamase class C family)
MLRALTHCWLGVLGLAASQVWAQPASTAAALTREDVNAWASGYMNYALQRGDVAGGVFVVVKNGEILFEQGYGFADVTAQKPIDAKSTLFRPGSISKLFTWTAVMQLVEQGKLNLDTDINEYLDFKVPARGGKPITLRNIMTHTSGFEEALQGLISSQTSDILSLESAAKHWVPDQIFAPGSTPAYSNYATGLAGYIVARKSGMSFDDYIEKNIFAPLGMAHSSFRQPLPAPLLAEVSNGYKQASEPPQPYEFINLAPAGSLASTGDDMSRFMIAHLQEGEYQGHRILQAETAKAMHSTALPMIAPLNRMLLGFYESNYNGHRIISHGGDTQWFHSDLHLLMDEGVGYFVSLNSRGKEGAAGPIREALFREFLDRYFPGPTLDGKVSPQEAAAHARMMAGHYDSSRRPESSFFKILGLVGETTVGANEDGTLDVSSLHGLADEPVKLREVAPFVWREVNGKLLVAAKENQGSVTRFSSNDLSPFTVFERTPWSQNAAWLMPLLSLSAVVLLLSALGWPFGALARRRYRRPVTLPADILRRYRWSRAACAAVLILSIGWAVAVGSALSNLNLLSGKLDGLFHLLQLTSVVVFLGAPVLAVWYALALPGQGTRWNGLLWNALVVVGCLTFLWVAVVFHLIGFSAHY